MNKTERFKFNAFFFQDAKQRPFRRAGRHSHALDLVSDRDSDFMGRVVYVVARCGVQGVIYPIKTDVAKKAKQFPLAAGFGSSPGGEPFCDSKKEETEVIIWRKLTIQLLESVIFTKGGGVLPVGRPDEPRPGQGRAGRPLRGHRHPHQGRQGLRRKAHPVKLL